MSGTAMNSNTAALVDLPPGDSTILGGGATEATLVPPEEDDYLEQIFTRNAESEFGPEAARRVAWPADDRLSPCYAHLLVDGGDNVQAAPRAFDFGAEAFNLILKANRYAPKGHYDVLAFGLRGARLRGGEKAELVETLSLEDVRPDHKTFRCVIGFYFRKQGKFSAYTASTVPWHEYMAAGTHAFNLLPTGCYIYKKGAHCPKSRARWVVPALRLSDASGAESGQATVLRTRQDAVFDMTDEWSLSSPSDNIHCAYSDTSFSSLGCQTVKGGLHDGLWGAFQATIQTLPANARVDYVLTTGAECSIASRLAQSSSLNERELERRLGRLRAGSEGAEVARLQAALGVQETGYFGAVTKKRLTEVQGATGLPCDGIFSPAVEAKLGWRVFGQGASATATQNSHPSAVTVGRALSETSPSGPSPEEAGSAPVVPAPAHARQTVAQSPQAVHALLSLQALHRIAPRPRSQGAGKIWDNYVTALLSADGAKVLEDHGLLASPQRLVFILANMLAETGGLSLIWENMSYSAERLLEIFGKETGMDAAEARGLAHRPEAIAERVYGLGNPRKAKRLGNIAPGDGFRYRGGGFLQTTGRENYRTLGKRIGDPLEDKPELIENALISLKAACVEWQREGLNTYADQGSFRACCNGINKGNPLDRRDPVIFDKRLFFLNTLLKVLGLPKPVRKAGSLELGEGGAEAAGAWLEMGDLGEEVWKVQSQLKGLGYLEADPNGMYTTETRDAVVLFQVRNGLVANGRATAETQARLASPDAMSRRERGAEVDEERRGGREPVSWVFRGACLSLLAVAVAGLLAVALFGGAAGGDVLGHLRPGVDGASAAKLMSVIGWLLAVVGAGVCVVRARGAK